MIQGFVIWRRGKDGKTIYTIYNGYGQSWSEFVTQGELN